MRLGDLLIRARRVTPEDVARALARVNQHGGRLGDNLVAIGAIDEKTLDGYYAKLESGVLPVTRGIKLDNDDLLRRIVIQKLMCNFELSMSSIEQGFPIRFRQYFMTDLEKLRAFEDDGLLTIDDEWISVTPKGRLLIRNICMVFDRYLRMAQDIAPQPLRYSKTI